MANNHPYCLTQGVTGEGDPKQSSSSVIDTKLATTKKHCKIISHGLDNFLMKPGNKKGVGF